MKNKKLIQEVAKKEKLESIATLASGIAHEIKNPLTAIKTFTEYLPQKLDDKEFLEKFSQIVSKEGDRIDDLVHQFMDFAKPAPIQLKQIDINKLIRETLDFLNNDFLKNNITTHLHASMHDTLFIQADSQQLRQAFLNIFLNAIDAMAHGGTLYVETTQNGSTVKIYH